MNVQQDEIWLGTLGNGEARWVVARTTMTVEEARQRHQATPVATAALGRLMTGALLLTSSEKGDNDVTLRLLGDGPLQGLLAIANSRGRVRGYVKEPQADVPSRIPGKLDVASAVGQGDLVVSRELDNGETYTGMVPIVSGEIAEDIVHYLLKSEQIPSALLLGVLVEQDHHVAGSAGLLLQLLPGAGEETIRMLEDVVGQLSQGISQAAAADIGMADFVKQLLGGIAYTVLDKRPVEFVCTCSRDRVAETLAKLGEKEIAELISAGEAEIVCHFCNERYRFSPDELEKIKERAAALGGDE